ncbi:MAG: DNA polymerase I, partial [Lachnospiraceae bacterium]
VEKTFKRIADFGETERVFQEAAKKGQNPDAAVGFQLIIHEEQVLGLSVCYGEDACYFLQAEGFVTGSYLIEKSRELFSQAAWVSVLQLKEQLPWLELDYGSSAWDAAVAGYLLNPLKDTYHYDDLARDYLGMTVPSQSDLLGKTGIGKAVKEEQESGFICACYQAYIAWKSAAVLLDKLKETGMEELFHTIEIPLIYSLYHMEQTGVKVEREALLAYGERLKGQIEVLEQQIYEETGEHFNINSPKQLGEILFDKMQLKGGKKTKTGYSTAADVLEKLAPEVPVVQKILDYRQLTKLNSTYAQGLSAFIQEDGRIHGKFNQTITATGRISSTEPNLQNIPVRMELGREIRKVFVPEDGYLFVDADYSQIELRILASMSGDERLITAYRQAQDIHAITASEVFHTPLDQVTSLQRRNAKAVNFGIVYGISAFGLSEDLSISRKEALEYIQKYFETYPSVKEFLDRMVEEGKTNGYVTTLFGRRRPIPELKSSNFMQRSFGERVAMNSPIQGTAADIMKIAMIKVDQALRNAGLKSRIVLQVHDELLVETWKEEEETVRRILTEHMKGAASLRVSLEVEAKTGDSWFSAH